MTTPTNAKPHSSLQRAWLSAETTENHTPLPTLGPVPAQGLASCLKRVRTDHHACPYGSCSQTQFSQTCSQNTCAGQEIHGRTFAKGLGLMCIELFIFKSLGQSLVTIQQTQQHAGFQLLRSQQQVLCPAFGLGLGQSCARRNGHQDVPVAETEMAGQQNTQPRYPCSAFTWCGKARHNTCMILHRAGCWTCARLENAIRRSCWSSER